MYKTFTFRQCHLYNRPTIETEITHIGPFSLRTVEVTPSTYERFVRLAASGLYATYIEPNQGTVVWSLTRLH